MDGRKTGQVRGRAIASFCDKCFVTIPWPKHIVTTIDFHSNIWSQDVTHITC